MSTQGPTASYIQLAGNETPLAYPKARIKSPAAAPHALSLQETLSNPLISGPGFTAANKASAVRHAYHQAIQAHKLLRETFGPEVWSNEERMKWWQYEVRWVNTVEDWMFLRDGSTLVPRYGFADAVLALVRERDVIDGRIRLALSSGHPIHLVPW